MATLNTFKGIEDFVTYNVVELKKQYLIFRQLLSILKKANQDKFRPYKLFNVVEKEITEIICLQTKSYIVAVSTKADINPDVYQLLKSTIKSGIITGVEILGERTLVTKLIEDFNLQFTIIKDRLVYECETTKEISACEEICEFR